MDSASLIENIADKNVNIDEYVQKVLQDSGIRKIVLENLFTNKNIMVYYHCFYIISKASQINPELFYENWNDFVSLLDHKNSYHRDIGITIISNLTKVDTLDMFTDIYEKYIEAFDDEKFMTAECFVKNLKNIVQYRNDYEKTIIEMLVKVDLVTNHTLKQKELLKSLIIELFESIYEKSSYKTIMYEFVKNQSKSISPKTKKSAKRFLAKHDYAKYDEITDI